MKLYITKNGVIKPLVVGKSGSVNVNASGSDLNFSMNRDDGPARVFLLDHHLEWCHEWVLVKGVRAEKKAYQLERKVQKRLNLYGS